MLPFLCALMRTVFEASGSNSFAVEHMLASSVAATITLVAVVLGSYAPYLSLCLLSLLVRVADQVRLTF